ncbi:gag-pol polyprotein [Cucumis melo var. makuwa]|uniref:Gag-pol polyprotein n=1 Tax=Cucumis melo var. makuwa TaxID=1194695 RepID=A0A5A7U5G1_CUCMM|nr:gag-pol polyprotein [Cucumis melo var. makuwa]
MSKDEIVVDYNERVLEIANESFNLGEKIHESKIVRKVLCSLPGKFDMKAECPMFLRKQKKNFRATLSDEETDDSEEDDGFTKAFIVNIIETDSIAEDEDSEEESENSLSYEHHNRRSAPVADSSSSALSPFTFSFSPRLQSPFLVLDSPASAPDPFDTMETSSGQHSETSPSLSPSPAPSTNNATGTVSSSKPPLPDKKKVRATKKTTSTVWDHFTKLEKNNLGAHAIIVLKSIVVILHHVELAHYGST